jgi:hypothetical protein
MIELANLNYDSNFNLDYLITKYANKNLEEMIHFAFDYIEASGDIESFSPPTLYAHSPNECLLRLKELWSFSLDHVLRRDISPVYQYHLYKIIEFYIDYFSDTEEDTISFDEPLIMYEMDDDLKKQVAKQYGEDSVGCFTDVRTYKEVFFYDWDFMPDFLAGVVQLHMDGKAQYVARSSIERLNSYTELMDGDTYRKFQTIRAQGDARSKQLEHQQETFGADLINALLSIQKNPQYWNLDENSINDRLCDLLRMKYNVYDQSRQGQSLTKEGVGEIDFLVFDGKEPVAIMEALKLNSLDKSCINNHITKLLVNYDPQGFLRASLIMYVTCKDFGRFWENFANHMSDYSFPYPVEGNFRNGTSNFSESRNAHVLLLRNNRPLLLSFYAIHLREKET